VAPGAVAAGVPNVNPVAAGAAAVVVVAAGAPKVKPVAAAAGAAAVVPKVNPMELNKADWRQGWTVVGIEKGVMWKIGDKKDFEKEQGF
jgi:tRNA G18 (ribose-2'-O)-methylase SpoU